MTKRTAQGTMLGVTEKGYVRNFMPIPSSDYYNNLIHKINRGELRLLIDSIEHGEFFTVAFTKRDGSFRVLNGRKGVTKYLAGGVNKALNANCALRVIYDVQKKDYRSFDLSSVVCVRHRHHTFVVA